MQTPSPMPSRVNWPQPLWLQLSNVWNCLSNAPSGWMRLPHGSINWMDAPSQQALQNLYAQANSQLTKNQSQNAHFDIAKHLASDAAQQWTDFLRGLWQYQQHPATRVETVWDIVAQQGAVALKRLPTSRKKPGTPVLLIPSLINRFHILDLAPEHSFARALQTAGHAVYLLDWHHDVTCTLPASIDNCLTTHLLPALAAMPDKPHVIGYCMGGTLSVLAARQAAQQMRSLTLIATPWDFHQPDSFAAQQFGRAVQDMQAKTPTDHIKADWLQLLFWQRDTLAALHKFKSFAHADMTGSAAQRFVLAEDWLNSGVDLPTALLADCAANWFVGNKPCRDTMLKPLRNLPIHLVAAKRDKLVPPDSAFALRAPHVTQTVCDTGHIGLFAGAKSADVIWPQVQHFLAAHNA